MNRRVVITGMGAISPIGNTAVEMWENAKKGVCGIGPITRYDTSEQKVKLCGEVKDFDPLSYFDKKEIRTMDNFTQYAVIAAREAVKQSGIELQNEAPFRCGVIISSGVGGLEIIEREHSRGLERGFDKVSPYFIPMCICNMASATVAIEFGFKGICSCTVTACAGGTNAIGDAFRQIRHGYSDVIICGGTESTITPLALGGFTSLRALSESTDPNRASIPFDKEREGFVLGEGAGVIVLEDYEHAIKRGANILGEIVGYGVTCDAYHMTSPLPDGSGAAKCMMEAIHDAGETPDKVDYINAHGTSTPLNDKGETLAIKAALGEHCRKVMVSSTKSMTGHLLGAAGGIEAILTTMAIKEGFAPATINYKVPDEDCDLDVVPNQGRKADIKFALSNSLGFGGHNGTLALKKYEK
ncbi:3-oxoacyl-[acyl-carrier-protein] synthase II [Hathewaya proteolytica DSM 3090]|uniref:3-oxoacyl-[acyl-carrier-protein] synthase 2 n=1 Tax=Hathewaya proteolytica DSM 3090 TaxID=1121331 RepID=A0A1M6M1R3_9CLOT|nr:beta-ketoacyl-ACP synthase II [Hathewaya proteolytica]SHJ77377.1 3-oxoacyl-[acyl-carrier-protein] synthase II [Hathewaya proteolytica DSM 3090]